MIQYARVADDGTVADIRTVEAELDTARIRKSPFDGFPALRPLTDRVLPEYDRKTHRLDGPFFDVSSGSVERYYVVVALSPSEAAAIIAERSGAHVNKTLAHLLFALNNRVRVLEGKQPLTAQEFKAVIEDAAFRSL